MFITSRKNASARAPAAVESARGTCSQITFKNCTGLGVGCVEGCGVLVLCCAASPLSLLSINKAASLFLGRAPGCHQNNTLSIIANLDCLFFPASCNRRMWLRMICCGDIVGVSCIIRVCIIRVVHHSLGQGPYSPVQTLCRTLICTILQQIHITEHQPYQIWYHFFYDAMIDIRLIFGHFESFLPKDTGCAH